MSVRAVVVALAVAAAGPAAARDAGPAPDPGGAARAVPATQAGAPSVDIAASARELELGAPFYLFVTVRHAPEVQVNLPASLALGDAFEETDRSASSRRNPDGSVTRTFELELMAFEVGDLEIPAITVTYAVRGRVRHVTAEPVPVHVVGVIGAGEPSLRDIARPVPVERRDLTAVYAGAAALAAVLVALAVWLAGRHRRRRAAPAPVRAERAPAGDEALARLEALEASGALDADDRKPAYVEMSEIVRAYLGRRYGFPALDLTTREIREHLEARDDAARAEALAPGWLEDCDLVKYANYGATGDDARAALDRARELVDATRPREVEAPVAAGRTS